MTHTLIVSTVTLISICLHFMRDSLTALDATDDFRTSAVLSVEDICMCLRAISALCIYSPYTLCGHPSPGHVPLWKRKDFLAVNLLFLQHLTCQLCPPSWPHSSSLLGHTIAFCLPRRTMACIDFEPGFQPFMTWHCTERSLMRSTTLCFWSIRQPRLQNSYASLQKTVSLRYRLYYVLRKVLEKLMLELLAKNTVYSKESMLTRSYCSLNCSQH